MNPTILTLRISRRAIGAAALSREELTLLDGRFLNSRPDRTIPAALRYIHKLVDLVRPTYVVIEAPMASEDSPTLTARLVTAIAEALRTRNLEVWRMNAHDVLAGFSIARVVDRREARDLARILWPDLERVSRKVQPYVADATAAAVYTECRLATGVKPT